MPESSDAIVFEPRFKTDPFKVPEPRPDGAVPFCVDGSGIGDLVVALGFVEGYRKAGVDSWLVCHRKNYQSLLRAFGEEPRVSDDDEVGGIRTGGRAHYYQPFLKEGHKTHTFVEWMSAHLPGNPEWVMPTLRMDPDVVAWAKSYDELTEWEKECGWADCSGPPILVFPESHYPTRTSPGAYWVDVCWALRRLGHRVFTMLPDERWAKAFPMHFIGQSLENLTALISRAGAVLGNDSGPGAAGVPTLAVCGPTQNMFSHYPSVVQVHASPKAVSCVGCWFQGARGYRSACDFGCRALMAVTPEAILDELSKLQPSLMVRPGVRYQPRPPVRPLEFVPGTVGEPVRSFALPVLSGRRVGCLREG